MTTLTYSSGVTREVVVVNDEASGMATSESSNGDQRHLLNLMLEHGNGGRFAVSLLVGVLGGSTEVSVTPGDGCALLRHLGG